MFLFSLFHNDSKHMLCCSLEVESMELTSFAHGVGQNSYHLVWKPKYAWDCFKFLWVKNDCEAIIAEAVLRCGMIFVGVGGYA